MDACDSEMLLLIRCRLVPTWCWWWVEVFDDVQYDDTATALPESYSENIC